MVRFLPSFLLIIEDIFTTFARTYVVTYAASFPRSLANDCEIVEKVAHSLREKRTKWTKKKKGGKDDSNKTTPFYDAVGLSSYKKDEIAVNIMSQLKIDNTDTATAPTALVSSSYCMANDMATNKKQATVDVQLKEPLGLGDMNHLPPFPALPPYHCGSYHDGTFNSKNAAAAQIVTTATTGAAASCAPAGYCNTRPDQQHLSGGAGCDTAQIVRGGGSMMAPTQVPHEAFNAISSGRMDDSRRLMTVPTAMLSSATVQDPITTATMNEKLNPNPDHRIHSMFDGLSVTTWTPSNLQHLHESTSVVTTAEEMWRELEQMKKQFEQDHPQLASNNNAPPSAFHLPETIVFGGHGVQQSCAISAFPATNATISTHAETPYSSVSHYAPYPDMCKNNTNKDLSEVGEFHCEKHEDLLKLTENPSDITF